MASGVTEVILAVSQSLSRVRPIRTADSSPDSIRLYSDEYDPAARRLPVHYGSSAQRLIIRGQDGNSANAIVTAFPADVSGSSSKPGKLLFNCQGNSCDLAQVWQGPLSGDRGLQLVGTERRHALSISARVVAVTVPTN